jgi:retron-type reverse transcriptase
VRSSEVAGSPPFLEHRIGDKRIIRLVQKWLKAGILEDGVVTVDDRGKPGQGSVISPRLANVAAVSSARNLRMMKGKYR